MARFVNDTYEPKTEDVGQAAFADIHEIRAKILELSDELPIAINDLRQSSKDWATKDNDMRKAKAKGFLLATGKNKEEREARADAAFEKERLAANIAEGEKRACEEYLRNLRATISALQSMLYASRSENDSIRYGQSQLT